MRILNYATGHAHCGSLKTCGKRLFYHELYWPVFAMFGLITLMYPVLVHHKLKEVK